MTEREALLEVRRWLIADALDQGWLSEQEAAEQVHEIDSDGRTGTMVTIEQARDAGYMDGYDMAAESGSVEAGADNWDGMLINAIGVSEVCALFGEPYEDNQSGWTPAMLAKLRAYNEGADQGARDAVGEREA